ncbi:MAG: aminotransferase class V-fold PLP-dependent enzyme [Candidatus Odinarchaeia archaeon]
MTLTPEDVRAHIPYLREYIYLDSNATTPVPAPVLNAMEEYFKYYCCNVERGAYSLANVASEKWDEAREKAARLLLNCEPEEFIFTRNLTQASNFVAYALENRFLSKTEELFEFSEPIINWKKGDKIVTTILEHHSNFLPWMRLSKKINVEFEVIEPPDKSGVLTPEIFEENIDEKTKFVALQHVSNTLGTVNDVESIVKTIKRINPECLVFIDGSQGPGHMEVDVKKIGCDFYGFSGHKGPLGPQGTGGLYVKKEILEKMEPSEIGGGVISDVNIHDYTLRNDVLSKRFDAGTPNIPGLIGLGRAAVYVVEEIGLKNIEEHEKKLVKIMVEELSSIPNVEVYGSLDIKHKSAAVSFNVKGWTSHDIGLYLDDRWKILVRSGHHCTIPLMKWLGVFEKYEGTVRASVHYYNTEEEVSKLITAVKMIAEEFS